MIHAPAVQVRNTNSAMDRSDLRVVVGILLNLRGQILISLRPNHVPQGGLWEFPGGKLEPNETPLQALRRELWEEIGIEVKSANFFSTVEHTYEDKRVTLEAWRVDKFIGEPSGKEGQKIEWIFPSELSKRNFPSPNQALIRLLEVESVV